MEGVGAEFFIQQEGTVGLAAWVPDILRFSSTYISPFLRVAVRKHVLCLGSWLPHWALGIGELRK